MNEEVPAELIARLWNWLPAFRVVAETEHLPSASEALYVTPSALSRTIRLLEKEVGRPLFRRVGRRIELNAAGHSLLARVRDAMRMVHRGVQEACDETLVGPVRIYSSGLITPLHVEPALERMRREQPQLIAYLRTILQEDISEALLRGHVDLAFLSEPLTHEQIETVYLGETTNGVYCGPEHPLYEQRHVAMDEVLEHAFASPAPDPSGATSDGWPVRVRRRVGLYADHMAVGIRACEQGRLLAVLPDAIGAQHGLRRLPMEDLPNAPMYAMHRPFLAEEERAQLFLDLVRDDIATRASGS